MPTPIILRGLTQTDFRRTIRFNLVVMTLEILQHGMFLHKTLRVYLLYKTTRTGGTTSLTSEIMNLKETFLFIVPTTDIGKITVYDAGKPFIEKLTDIYHAQPNAECKEIRNLYESYPHLKELPFLLLRDCELCQKISLNI
ncbi:hypothetical protein [Methanolobus sp.]|uniref:hypothetical protein n=1 Tax=Methanolobus sp. TaxID=1874737 RepID=UPI0025E529B5|nr:hypothetical protein [Methanolobus sp.]